MKKCCKCHIKKELDEFNKNKSNADGLADYCKPCLALYRSERRKEIRRDKKKYRDTHKDERNQYQNEYRAKDRQKAKIYNAKYTYGLEPEEYKKLISRQKCDICDTTDPGAKDFHIDHCHETGKIRGLLCQSCNHLLGCAKDNITNLQKAINYLDRNKKV